MASPSSWLLRGAVLAVVHAAAETVRADFGVHNPTSRTVFEAIMLGVLVAVAACWAAVDTWQNLDQRGRVWLISSLIAGWGAAVLGVIGKSIFVDQTGVSELGTALTGGAAFTALLVLVPAGIGMLAGRWIRAPGRHATVSEEDSEDQRGGPKRSTPRS